jgi:hypothetical protein
MPYMSDRQSVAANAVVQNALSGKTNEFITAPSIIRFGATAAAIGAFLTILVGNEVICEDQELNSQNRMPVDPDDFNYEASGMPGDRIVVKLRNSTGAAIICFVAVKVSPFN